VRAVVCAAAAAVLGLAASAVAADKARQPTAAPRLQSGGAAASPDRRFDALFQASRIDIADLQARSSSAGSFASLDGLMVNRGDRTLSRTITSCEINQAPADVAVIYDLKAPMSDRITCSGRHSVTHEAIDVVAEYASRLTVNGDVLSLSSNWTTDEHDNGGWGGTGAVRWLSKGTARMALRIAGSRCDVLDYHDEMEEVVTHPGTSEPPTVTTVATDKTQSTTCALER
jgi:hypothetical protein